MPPKTARGAKSNASKGSAKSGSSGKSSPANGLPGSLSSLSLKNEEPVKISNLTCTGTARRNVPYSDIIIDNFSVVFHGKEIIKDTVLELSGGRRYGLIGANGSGKSLMLKSIGEREVPIPKHFDLFYLDSEIPAGDESALEAVLAVDAERAILEKEADEISQTITDDTPHDVHDYLNDIYERLEKLESNLAEVRGAKILSGLGFSPAMQKKKTRDFSGGWRMRIALARALFIQPSLLLLDEPTNHLDIEAVVWLENYLQTWNDKGILLLVSHSQDFLNSVCTDTIHLHKKQLKVYTGNYDQYIMTRAELEENQMKMFKWQQEQIKTMKEYIAKFGHGSRKLARQAQSKEKVLAKMERGGLVEKVVDDHVSDFCFPDPDPLSPPVLVLQNISFGYPGCPLLYEDVDLGVDLDSRVSLVGPNGAGKSTLLKLMTRELDPIEGMVRHHPKLKLGRFHQHFVDQLDMSMSPMEYLVKEYADAEHPAEGFRKWLGRYDVTGSLQTQPMSTLSDGQKSRVVFAWMAFQHPHILLLDEPTNHLDMETIDSLALAINNFEGGVVLVSHDMRLISQVTEEIWLCDNRKVVKYAGDLDQYKQSLVKKLQKANLLENRK
mmetsp:Transcript_43343/g.70336  ORF Transcript_43343/g.70336 Transcript_43343/m.70336 type:complete len:609 (+) Transcript_43343:187-2013(+)|eukprot:CAMPEP_0184655936 /NCGR_PEP_ID=MMETSP0308-20130426/14974_1 /TAXON_ID=38269 /ORGANISM="Gloeochaete witrockiana, Strain SAG 46.84" /LENGTH=608 /DNA_ID=CAMNT_0027092765 /DNA_START=172 /DNA_END=1998 /DNA_ORIENTATION=-